MADRDRRERSPMNTFELVRNGYEKDIVVYDSEGVGLTKRLLSHIKNIARREPFS